MSNTLRRIMVFTLIFLPSLPAYGAPQLWRNTVIPGETTYYWDVAGKIPIAKGGEAIPGSFTLQPQKSGAAPITLTQTPTINNSSSPDDAIFFAGLIIPSDTPPGTYTLFLSGFATPFNITVNAQAPAPKVVVLSPPAIGTNCSAIIQRELDAGNSVLLAPGFWTIQNQITIPSGLSVRGVHRDLVVIQRLTDPNPTFVQFNRAFTTPNSGKTDASNISIGGFTYDASQCPAACLFHSNGVCTNLEFSDARIIKAIGPIVTSAPGTRIDNVEVINGAIAAQAGQMYTNITLRGVFNYVARAAMSNEVLCGGNPCMVNITWDDTYRGMTLRNVDNAYFANLVFRNIVQGNNSGELINIENGSANGCSNTIFTHLDAQSCNGCLFEVFQTPTANNRIRHYKQNGGSGIRFFPGGGPQTGNEFTDGELSHNAGFDFGGATGNFINGLAIVAPCNSRSNQVDFNANYYNRSTPILGGRGNVINRVKYCDMPVGWKTSDF